jgi:hypothetical protein
MLEKIETMFLREIDEREAKHEECSLLIAMVNA